MDDHDPSRRAFVRDTLRTLVTYSLLEICFRYELFAPRIDPIVVRSLLIYSPKIL